jgi:hypothetical protein
MNQDNIYIAKIRLSELERLETAKIRIDSSLESFEIRKKFKWPVIRLDEIGIHMPDHMIKSFLEQSRSYIESEIERYKKEIEKL